MIDKIDMVTPNNATPSSETLKLMSRFCVTIDDDPLIFLNISGTHMTTRRSTLMRIPNTVLALAFISPWSERITHDNDGRLFFDCDSILFQYLLNQLRDWSSSCRVFDLPKKNQFERERFRSLCIQLNFDLNLIKYVDILYLMKKGFTAMHAGTYRFAECLFIRN